LTEDGKVVLCLNAPSLDTSWLNGQVEEQAPELEFVERVSNPDTFADMQPERGLKVMLYRKKR
jgi:23S rRNA (cytosine1962-C5)-methyltransferase